MSEVHTQAAEIFDYSSPGRNNQKSMEETTIPTNPFPRMDITPFSYGDGAGHGAPG